MPAHPFRFLAPVLLLAGCAVVPAARPPAPAPSPRPAAPPPPTAADWRDRAEAIGSWRYAPSPARPGASFGPAGRSLFSLSCDRANRRITLWVAGGRAGPMTVRTSYGARSLTAEAAEGGSAAALAASDPLLDQLAFSRGRISISAPGTAELVLPAWAEPARVIEDCRG